MTAAGSESEYTRFRATRRCASADLVGKASSVNAAAVKTVRRVLVVIGDVGRGSDARDMRGYDATRRGDSHQAEAGHTMPRVRRWSRARRAGVKMLPVPRPPSRPAS